MDILSSVLSLLFTWVVVLSLQMKRSKLSSSKKLPPGPTSFPIIGNLLELGDKPHKSLTKLAKVYGPLMSLKLGQVTTIVISSPTIAKEVLQNHDISFCNRPVVDSLQAHQHQDVSMAWLPASTTWRNLRKICNSHIFTTQKLDANQDLRHKKVEQLLDYVRESCVSGKAIDIGQAAFNTSLNLLSNTMFSVDLADPSSDAAREFKKLIWNIIETL